jgi:peroxiredoxin
MVDGSDHLNENRPGRAHRVSGLVMVGALALGLLAGAPASPRAQSAGAPPAVGDKARAFSATRADGQVVPLSSLIAKGPVVLLMLRGWVGYQCPFCTRQVGDYLGHAKEFQAAGASVILVYPGASEIVKQKADEFIEGKSFPDNFHVVLDPDLAIVNLYDLRWNAPNETSYPSTFVFDGKGVVRYVKISHAHGDRSAAPDVLALIKTMK